MKISVLFTTLVILLTNTQCFAQFTLGRIETQKNTIIVKTTQNNQIQLDVIEIITVFSSKIYGLRSHKNKKALADKSANAQVCSV